VGQPVGGTPPTFGVFSERESDAGSSARMDRRAQCRARERYPSSLGYRSITVTCTHGTRVLYFEAIQVGIRPQRGEALARKVFVVPEFILLLPMGESRSR